MPDDYEPSVGKLQNYFSDEQICTILCSSNSTIANRKILDCLIERMRRKEDLLDLCDQLEKIIASLDLMNVVNEIRTGQYYYLNNSRVLFTAYPARSSAEYAANSRHY